MTLTRLTLFLFFSVFLSCAEDDPTFDTSIADADFCLVEIDGEFQDISLDLRPEFLDDGSEGFAIASYGVIKYPSMARENGTQGTCLLNYEITESGTVENIVIVQDPGDGIGEESKRTLSVITEGVSFSPGILNGNAIRVKKRISVKFKLQ